MYFFILLTASLSFASVQEDRVKILTQVKKDAPSHQEFIQLKQEVETLKEQYKDIKQDKRKSVVKTIGYTSSTLGFVNSVWAYWEKRLSIKNSLTDLNIRLNTRKALQAEVISLEALATDELGVKLLNQKINALSDVNEKIGNLHTRLKISRMGLNRAVFKGVTSTGLFLLTVFIDDITRWWESLLLSTKQQAKLFWFNWDTVVYEASLLPSDWKDVSPEDKALVFFLPEHIIGIPDEDMDEALEYLKGINPESYRTLLIIAKHRLEEVLKEDMNEEILLIQKHKQKFITPIDKTSIQPVVIMVK
jgi:hypothetical protein